MGQTLFNGLLASVIAMGSLQSMEKWIIDQNQKEKWEAVLDKAGLTQEYVEDILSKFNLVELEFGQPNAMGHSKIESLHQMEPERLLWDDGIASVYYARNPRVRNHLWVVLNRPVDRFSEVLPEEMVAIRAVVNKAIQILRDVFKIPNATIAQYNEVQPGQIPHRFTVEILPPSYESKDVLNLIEHIDRYFYILRRGVCNSFCPSFSNSEIETDAVLWKQSFEENRYNPYSADTREDSCESWLQTQTHRLQEEDYLLNCFFDSLIKEGLKIERMTISAERASQDTIQTTMKKCAFCNPKVIESQKIYETPYVYLFYNYKSAVLGSHFLMIPKRHVQLSVRLTQEEIKDMHKIAIKLSSVLEKQLNRTDFKMYIQDGPSVGQTVDHTQMHFLPTPSLLKHIIWSLNYESERCYSREEMEPLIRGVRQALQEP